MPPPDPGAPADARVPENPARPPDRRNPAPPPGLAAAVRAAAAGGHLESTLRDVVRAATDVAGARYGALGVLSADGRRLDRLVVSGMTAEDEERIGRLPSGQGILRWLVDHPEPLRLEDLGAHPAFIGLPSGHPPMRSFLGVPVRLRDAVFGHLYLTEKRDGGPFTAADEEAVQALAATAGLAVENARLAEAADRRRAWAQAGSAVVTSLLSGAAVDRVLHEVAERVHELVPADVVGVLGPCPGDDDALTLVAAVGAEAAADVEGVRVPLAGTRLGEAYRSGIPLVLDNTTARAESTHYPAVVRELLAGGFGPGLVIPLTGRPAQATIVALRQQDRPGIDEETVELASAFAVQVSVALELARSHDRERRLQVVADRERIARDLHDHVVQRIYATGLALDRVSRSLQATAPEAAARIAERVDELDETIARIRTAIFELHQEADGSAAAVRRRLAEVVRSVTEGHGLRVDLRIRDSSEDLPPELVHDVVAVVRELVTNVVRHADASRVTVTVQDDYEVAVEVTDDGRGLPAVTVRSGLANLADRAERRGGRLSVASAASGTEVRWSVPRPGRPDQVA